VSTTTWVCESEASPCASPVIKPFPSTVVIPIVFPRSGMSIFSTSRIKDKPVSWHSTMRMLGWSARDRSVEQAKSGMSTAVDSYALLRPHGSWILSAKMLRLVFLLGRKVAYYFIESQGALCMSLLRCTSLWLAGPSKRNIT
jgi:hypothetical protein